MGPFLGILRGLWRLLAQAEAIKAAKTNKTKACRTAAVPIPQN